MIHDPVADHDVSWLAIRQPAVMRLLESELAAPDGDAFAAGLELACRVLGSRTSLRASRSGESIQAAAQPRSLGDLRLDHKALAAGLASVRAGRCDRAMVQSLRDQIEELPVALTAAEQAAVATVIAAVIWAVLDASVRDLGDTLVA